MAHKKPEVPPDLPAPLRTETLAKGGWVDRDFAARWLVEHWSDRTCPACHQNNWGMLEELVQLPVGPRVPVAPQEYPCILVTCRNCGYLMIFSAMRMGIVPSNVYLVSRDQMRQVATTSAAAALWRVIAAASAGLGIGFLASGVMSSKPLYTERTVLFQILPAGLLILFAISLLAILLERRRRRALLAGIEEESRIPTESRIEPAEMSLE